MPSCCCYACLTFHRSDPEDFLHTFFRRSGWNAQHFFPSPPSNQVSAIPKPKTTNVSCYRFVTWQHLVEEGFSLSSGLESPGSPRPSWNVDAQNMYPIAVHITCGRKPLRLMPMCWRGCEKLPQSCWWTVVECCSLRRTRFPLMMVLIRSCYIFRFMWCIIFVGCLMFPWIHCRFISKSRIRVVYIHINK